MKTPALFLLYAAAYLATSSPAVSATKAALLVHTPAISRTQIVFSYAGDLWSVSREGGSATRLTTGQGIESNPVFSPDGASIAFTGEYDGNIDVYTIPAAGGIHEKTLVRSAIGDSGPKAVANGIKARREWTSKRAGAAGGSVSQAPHPFQQIAKQYRCSPSEQLESRAVA